MNREQILSILYEMAIVIGGETSLQPLLTKTLQRLMYHTSFPAGMILSGAKGEPPVLQARLETAIGDFDLTRLAGTEIQLPSAIALGDAAIETDPALISRLPCRKDHYTTFLRLPVERYGVIILLAPAVPESGLPVTRVFRPIISNFAKAILLCQRNETYTSELISQRNLAAEANRAKSVFLANMSHELRTPMNAILGFAQLLQKDESLTELQRSRIDTISRSGHHLLTLINDVLEISKIEAGKVTAQPRAFDLQEVFASIEEMVRMRAEKKGLAMRIEVDDRLPHYVRGDDKKLRQVLVNLLGNAVKFTQHGTITLRVTRDDGSAIRFDVIDTGCGVAPEEQAKIFEAFYQTADASRRGEGTGLGLTISREYVELMGGTLEMESAINRGSTFHFSIPLEPVTSVQIEPTPGSRHVVGVAPGQPRLRILIAEDHQDNRLLLRQLLESAGFEVREAENGEQALNLFNSWHPHLIWMDMRMPVMDGYEATRRIKATPDGHNTVILALTASAFEEDRAEVLASGCDGFLRKPLDVDEVFAAMGRYLGIEYVYTDAPPPSRATTDAPLDRAALARIGPSLRAELSRAAIILDPELARAVIARIGSTEPSLMAPLNRLVTDYRFDQLLAVAEDGTPPDA